MQNFTKWLLVIVAITQFLPVVGVLGAETLGRAYAIDIADPNVAVLLQHRAVLFGILGAFIGWAAFRPELQSIAMALAFTMILSFLALWAGTDGLNSQLDRLATGDAFAAICLGIATVLRARERGLTTRIVT